MNINAYATLVSQSPYKGFNSFYEDLFLSGHSLSQSPYKGFNSNERNKIKGVCKSQSPYKGFNSVNSFQLTVQPNVSIPL